MVGFTLRALRATPLAAIATLALSLGACGSVGNAGGGKAGAGGTIAFAGLTGHAGDLIDGSTGAFRNELATLKGHPVVVNQWASWCGPCKFEFPFFATAAKKYAGRIAFLGVNSNDSKSAAAGFLKSNAVPYPHFSDPDVKVARLIGGGRAWPTTAFYDADGKRVDVHVGAYATAGKLDENIQQALLRR